MARDFIVDGGEDKLSMKALIELLGAVTEKGRAFRFRASGISMIPFIKDRDIITISPIPSGRPVIGDVVAFILPETGRLAVHRIIDKKNHAYIIKGDNIPEPDGLVPSENVLGLVTAVERNSHRVLLGLGMERRVIAALARHDLLKWIRMPSLARKLIAMVLIKLQGAALYRKIAGKLGPEFSITQADGKDMEKVHEIWNPGGRLNSCKPDPLVKNYVAKIDSEIVGFVQRVTHPPNHHPYAGHWLFSLMVRVKARGMGIGESLCRHLIDVAREDGIEELLLLVYEDNSPAINLYRKLGFKLTKLPDLQSKLDEELLMTGRRRIIMYQRL
ncbi:MAG: GNAT family N-acetyltransferase [Methanothrix sp.]|nr:GNAT family N-acetyltransferase [Methanothrix sp.]